MSDHYSGGRRPDFFNTCSDALRRDVIKRVLDNFESGISYESCCWAEEVPPDTFTRWRQEDQRLEIACRKRLALIEKHHVRIMNGKADPVTGEMPTATDRRFSQEILKQTNRAWAPKQAGAQLAEGLAELQKALPAPVYALVISTLHKHVDS